MQCSSYLITCLACVRAEKDESCFGHILCHEHGSAAFMKLMEAGAIVEAPDPALDSFSIESKPLCNMGSVFELVEGANDSYFV